MRDVTVSLYAVCRPGLAKSIISCRKLFIILAGLAMSTLIIFMLFSHAEIVSGHKYKSILQKQRLDIHGRDLRERLELTTATLRNLLHASWWNGIGDPGYKVTCRTYILHLSPVKGHISWLFSLLLGIHVIQIN